MKNDEEEKLCYAIDEAKRFVFLEWRKGGKVIRTGAMGLKFDSILDRKYASSPPERRPLWEACRDELLKRKLIREP
jgi:hypothetical protein